MYLKVVVIPKQNQVYLHSDMTISINLTIELQTGSNKNVTGHVI